MGLFATTTRKEKDEAKKLVDKARDNGNLARAAAPGSSRTYQVGGGFHLDRQTPSDTSGNRPHKVAVQKNQGSPSTVGQVIIPPKDIKQPTAKLVAKRLKHSVNVGRETAAFPSQKSVKKVASGKAEKQKKRKKKA